MANRFWVGGSGSLDGSTTTHIAATSNGAGGASYPGSGDTLTLDSNSGGGTVTFAADHTLQSFSMSSFTGTVDNSANNNNITLTNNTGTVFNASGSATQTLNMGNGVWTVSGTAALWNTVNNNLTLNANSSTLRFTGVAATERLQTLGNKTYNIIDFDGVGAYRVSSTGTITSLVLGPGVSLQVPSITINGISSTATLSSPATLTSNNYGTAVTVSGNATFTISNCAIKDLTFSGGNTRTANNSFNLGNNSGITINAPSGGGSNPARVIGS